MIDRLIELAERLRRAGIDVPTSGVLDAARALDAVDLGDAPVVRAVLRATLVKEPDHDRHFDRCFAATFRSTDEAARAAGGGGQGDAAPGPGSTTPGRPPPAAGLPDDVLAALLRGDDGELAALAADAVARLAGLTDTDGSERFHLHRVMRALDLTRMLSAAMRTLRSAGDLDEFELMLRRNELTRRLEEFRRRLAAEIASRLDGARSPVELAERTRLEDLDLLHLSRAEQDELRRMLQPLLRRLAARIGRRRRARASGRLDVRRTVRRSLQTGGVPIDVAQRRRHPHRPELVVLCDVSGSVAEFAQFTFTLVNALQTEVRRVRSFAFVDGVAEVTDVFRSARYDIPVNRLVERRGVVGLDGHSDYGAVFTRFRHEHLDDVVGTGTTLIVTGDARGHHRDPAVAEFERIAARARRVYWLNPEPVAMWGEDDSLAELYGHACTTMREVRTAGQLADAIADLI